MDKRSTGHRAGQARLYWLSGQTPCRPPIDATFSRARLGFVTCVRRHKRKIRLSNAPHFSYLVVDLRSLMESWSKRQFRHLPANFRAHAHCDLSPVYPCHVFSAARLR